MASRQARSRGWLGAALVLVLGACSTGGTGAPGSPATPRPTPDTPPTAAPATAAPASPGRSPSATTAALGRLARNGPESGTWVGLNIDWAAETVAEVTSRLGSPPAAVVSFVAFPLTGADTANLDSAAAQARDVGAVLVVTLEPWDGLAAATAEAARELARRLAGYGTAGVPAIVRFAHEMNGSWYPWGQDPVAYVAAFRRVADAVHGLAPTAATLWAPNQGAGYPYSGGEYEARPGGPEAGALDTDGDGSVDEDDDPYAPYWPGEGFVDWVGMSLYHWGTAHPWGENEVPAAGSFDAMITGSPAVGGDSSPDFHADYAERFGKPLAIVETAAFYRPDGGGAEEQAIKSAWLDQVFAADARSRYPFLRLVNWFEWRKQEAEVGAVVDWRITADPALRDLFLAAMADGFRLGPAVPPGATGPGGQVP